MLLRFWFSKALSNKISLALILNRKSCICCRKHCSSLFSEAHGMCGLKEIFEGAGNFFHKKVHANPTFHLEKLNLIRFIKALIKGFTLFSPHLSLRDIFPTKWKTLKISQMDLQKMQWNCILPKVLLDFFQKIAGGGKESHGLKI